MKSILYLRVSDEEQIDGASLEVQEAACRAKAESVGAEEIEVERDEGRSAKSMDRREGLLRILQRCRRERPAFLVVHKLDRVARNAADYHAIRATLAQFGTRIISASEHLTDDPAGRLMESMLASIAQFDNEVRGERTRDCMRSIVASGGWCHKAPLGYVNARDAANRPTLAQCPDKGQSVAIALERYSTGQWTQARCAEFLGIQKQRFNKMLSNPLYAGFSETLGVEVKGGWKPLVSRLCFDRIRARLNGHAAFTRVVDHPDFPLRGFLRCGCSDDEGEDEAVAGNLSGRAVTGSYSKSKTGARYAYYHCNACGNRMNAKKAEAEFVEMLRDQGMDDAELKSFLRNALNELKGECQAADERLEAAKRQVKKLEAERKKLLKLFTGGKVDEEMYRERDDELKVQLAVARVESSESDIGFSDLEATLAFARELCRTPDNFWMRSTLQVRRAVQWLYFPEGLILASRTPANNRADKRLQPPVGSESILASPGRLRSNPREALLEIERIRLLAA